VSSVRLSKLIEMLMDHMPLDAEVMVNGEMIYNLSVELQRPLIQTREGLGLDRSKSSLVSVTVNDHRHQYLALTRVDL